jgi:hypothetical protein
MMLSLDDTKFERSWERNEEWISPRSNHILMIPFLREKFPHVVTIKVPTSDLDEEITRWIWERIGTPCLISNAMDTAYVSWSTGTWIVVSESHLTHDYLFEHAHEAIEFKLRWHTPTA